MKKVAAERRRRLVVTFCCNREEFEAIQAAVGKTTCRSMSEYARKVLLGKPVTVVNRNLSLDQVIDAVNGVRNKLEKLGVLPADKVANSPELIFLLGEMNAHLQKIVQICIRNGV